MDQTSLILEDAHTSMGKSLVLPELTTSPIHHPHSCLSLSTTLITYLADVFSTSATNQLATSASRQSQRRHVILSVGSGTGLLEELINQYLQHLLQKPDTAPSVEGASEENRMKLKLRVEGVEVHASPPVNRYLPDDGMHIVNGTWDVSPLIDHHDDYGDFEGDAKGVVVGLVFVYPREVKLVQKYIEQIIGGSAGGKVGMVVWTGPRRDVEEYDALFRRLVLIGWERRDEASGDVGVKAWEGIVVLRRGAGSGRQGIA